MQPMSLWQLFLNNPEWALVAVGIVTFIVIGWQAVETRRAAQASKQSIRVLERQTKATEDAAKAAQASAEAMISSERAWVIAELIPICRQLGNLWYRPSADGWAVLSDAEILNGEYLKHKLKFTNLGRTPAHILGFQIGYSCLLEGVRDLPEGSSGDLVEFHSFDHLLTASGATEVLEPIIDVDWYLNSSNSIEVIRAIREFKYTAVFHGWVGYQHVFSSSDVIEEPFCYSYSPQNKRLNRVVRPKTAQANADQKPN